MFNNTKIKVAKKYEKYIDSIVYVSKTDSSGMVGWSYYNIVLNEHYTKQEEKKSIKFSSQKKLKSFIQTLGD